MRCIFCFVDFPSTKLVVVMAPALIMGLSGRPVLGSRLMELKASPVGSIHTLPVTAVRPLSSKAMP